MGTFSEMDWNLDEQETTEVQNTASPFELGANEAAADSPANTFDDDARQQAESDTAQAALSKLNGEDTPTTADTTAKAESPEENDDSEDQKRLEHEAKEAERKAEWDAKQAAKKAAEDKALQELQAMSDDSVADASVKRLGLDAERLTRRNMKMCVAEHVQTLCLDNSEFARKAMHPRKNLINCLKYINRHAKEFLEQEMDDNDEKPTSGMMGGDVPDDLCYKWAEDYFNDDDAQEDKTKDEVFVPRPYYGKSSSKKKKAPAKKKAPKKPAEKPEPQSVQVDQITLDMGA